MSENIYAISAYSPINVPSAAERTPWGFERSSDSEPGPNNVEFYGRTITADRKVLRLSNVQAHVCGSLREFGLDANIEFTYETEKHGIPEVERADWAKSAKPILAELFAAGPSYGRITDAHCDNPIIWAPSALYVKQETYEIPLYADLVKAWPGIEVIHLIEETTHSDLIPWFSGRLPMPYPFSEGRQLEINQLNRLFELFADWKAERPASSLLHSVEEELAEIRLAAVLVPVLVRLFPTVNDRIHLANSAFLHWHAGDLPAFDEVMSRFAPSR